jgi:hypothetical protein
MCAPIGYGLKTKPQGTEREELESALERTAALNRVWCEDGQRILSAARKYLASLPKPIEDLRDAVREARAGADRGWWNPTTSHLRALAEAGEAQLAAADSHRR